MLVSGTVGYAAKPTRGKTLDTHLFWRAAAKDGALEARLPKTGLLNFIPVTLEGMTDNWSAFLFDRKRPAGANFRAIPVQDGVAYTQLDVTEGDADVFIGHPIVCDRPELKLHVAWKSPGKWFVEAHNPSEKPITAKLRANDGWPLFPFNETITLAPGSSRVWEVAGK
jgi:hypothetical protein